MSIKSLFFHNYNGRLHEMYNRKYNTEKIWSNFTYIAKNARLSRNRALNVAARIAFVVFAFIPFICLTPFTVLADIAILAENGFRSNFRYAVLLNHKKSNLDLVVSKLNFVLDHKIEALAISLLSYMLIKRIA